MPVGGHRIQVESIRLIGESPTQLGFEFTLRSNTGVMGATIRDAAPLPMRGGSRGGGGGAPNETFLTGWTIEGYDQAGLKTFVISDIYVNWPGPWRIVWQPSDQ